MMVITSGASLSKEQTIKNLLLRLYDGCMHTPTGGCHKQQRSPSYCYSNSKQKGHPLDALISHVELWR